MLKTNQKAQRVEDGYIMREIYRNVKVYSNGFRKKLSNQNPFWKINIDILRLLSSKS
jgi:hypothetical protein